MPVADADAVRGRARGVGRLLVLQVRCHFASRDVAAAAAPPRRRRGLRLPHGDERRRAHLSVCLSIAAAVRDTVQGCGIGAEITRRTSRACQPAPTPTAMAKSLTRDFADTRKNLKRFAPSR